MKNYLIAALVIRLLADFLLIMAVNRLSVPGKSVFRGVLGAVVGCVYAAGCTLVRWQFLRHPIGYVISLLITCLTAFGVGKSDFRKWPMFCLLRLGLDGMGNSTGKMIGAALLFGVCLYGFRWSGKRHYVPVELEYGKNRVTLQALYDTGHRLTDPVTGKPVLVVGADIACQLTGLTPQQLRKPVETIGVLRGLRLIPYQTVGRSGEMMLALMPDHIRIGKRKRKVLVAFAPQVLDEDGKFQGLIGGTV